MIPWRGGGDPSICWDPLMKGGPWLRGMEKGFTAEDTKAESRCFCTDMGWRSLGAVFCTILQGRA